MNPMFISDINLNQVNIFRKKYWVLWCIRHENCTNYPFKRVYALIKKILLWGTGCELPSSAFQGGGIRFPHLNGIVINNLARIGNRCTIFHQVTIGIASGGHVGAPVIGDGVTIGAGSKIIGPVVIGDEAIIGANAVITKSVPKGATVVGANRIVG